MAGYVIANVDVKDTALFEQYRKQVPDFGEVLGGAQQQFLALLVVLVDRARVGASQPVRVRDDRRQHGLEVERRPEDLADLPERLQLPD